MAAPRFRLRSLVVLIVFLAMALTIGLQSLELRRLRTERDRVRLEAKAVRDWAEAGRLLATRYTYAARLSAAKEAADRAMATRLAGGK
jgi:hypothetical protein